MAYNFSSLDYGNAINNAYNRDRSERNPYGEAWQNVGNNISSFGDRFSNWQNQERQWDQMLERQRKADEDAAYRTQVEQERYDEESAARKEQVQANKEQQNFNNKLALASLALQKQQMDNNAEIAKAEAQKVEQEKALADQMAIDLKDFNDYDWSESELGKKLLGMDFDPTVENDAKTINEVQKLMGIKPTGNWGRESQETYDGLVGKFNDYNSRLLDLYSKYGAANVIKSMDDAAQLKMFENLMAANKKAATPEPDFIF